MFLQENIQTLALESNLLHAISYTQYALLAHEQFAVHLCRLLNLLCWRSYSKHLINFSDLPAVSPPNKHLLNLRRKLLENYVKT